MRRCCALSSLELVSAARSAHGSTFRRGQREVFGCKSKTRASASCSGRNFEPDCLSTRASGVRACPRWCTPIMISAEPARFSVPRFPRPTRHTWTYNPRSAVSHPVLHASGMRSARTWKRYRIRLVRCPPRATSAPPVRRGAQRHDGANPPGTPRCSGCASPLDAPCDIRRSARATPSPAP